MVPEINFLPLLSGSVLHIECANEISSPASQQSIQELEHDSGHHSQLRKRVRQRQQHLCYLQSET